MYRKKILPTRAGFFINQNKNKPFADWVKGLVLKATWCKDVFNYYNQHRSYGIRTKNS